MYQRTSFQVSIQMIIIMSVKQLVPILKDVIRTLNINRIQEELKIKLLAPFVSCCNFDFAHKWTNMAKQNLEGFSKLLMDDNSNTF